MQLAYAASGRSGVFDAMVLQQQVQQALATAADLECLLQLLLPSALQSAQLCWMCCPFTLQLQPSRMPWRRLKAW